MYGPSDGGTEGGSEIGLLGGQRTKVAAGGNVVSQQLRKTRGKGDSALVDRHSATYIHTPASALLSI